MKSWDIRMNVKTIDDTNSEKVKKAIEYIINCQGRTVGYCVVTKVILKKISR